MMQHDGSLASGGRSDEAAGWALCVVECPQGRPRVSSARLFPAGHTELRIEHQGTEYCLRITGQDGLVLHR